MTDAGVMILLGCFFVLVGSSATLLIWLMRRVMSRECPHCFRRIPKDAFKHGVPCPDCEAELEQSGKKSLLSEEMPYSVVAMGWRAFLLTVASIGGFAMAVALAVGTLSGNWSKALQGFAVILFLGSPVILLFTVAYTVALPLARLKAMVWNDQLIVRNGMELLVVPLAECSWREGKLSEMNVFKLAFLLSGRALIMELPAALAKEGNQVAVGFTDETREMWQSLFEVAGVPRTTRKSWWKKTFGSS